LKKPNFKTNFKNRTILYLFFGVFCASLDFFSFTIFSKLINPLFANPISYSLGSGCSFLLNKNFTFKSANTRLSFRRYLLVILIGLASSQIIIFIGINIFNLTNFLYLIKWIAMCSSALLQYFGNTLFSNVKN